MSILNSSKLSFPAYLLTFFLIFLLMNSTHTNIKQMITADISMKMLLTDTLYSFLRVSITAIIAWLCAIFIGYLMYSIKTLFDLLIVSVNFIRHISPFAWLPFAIFWFGLGETPVSFILLITLFFPTLIAVINILSNIPAAYLEEAQVLGAGRFQIFLRIQLPLTLKDLLNTFRIIWGLGWTTIIAVEMLGVNNGLGFRLLDFRYMMNYSAMIIYIIIMGGIGVTIDFLLRKLIAR